MKPYYDLVMAEALNRYAKEDLAKAGFPLEGVAPDGASEDERWATVKKAYYRVPILVITEWGVIDFDPDFQKELSGGENLSYDDYLELMKKSGRTWRKDFMKAFYDASYCCFNGRVERINRKKGTVCFERIYISGEYINGGGDGFFGKEDHVWMNLADFPSCKKGDCFSFEAEVYRYVKTGNGKMIDFGLRNPELIKPIDEYELPSDGQLIMQEIDEMICSCLCMYDKHCYGNCIANQDWLNSTRAALLLAKEPNKMLLEMLGLK